MHPILFKIGPITIYTYGFLMAVAIISGIIIASYRGEKIGIKKDIIYDLSFYGILGGLIGAKLLYFIAEAKTIFKNPKEILYMLTSGFVVYGALIGGVLTGYIYCKVKGINFLKMFDLLAPSMAFAQGVGRLGCFFAGCCYGKPTDLPIGVVFKNSPFAPNGVKLIPTQLISSIGNFIIFTILILYSKKERKQGKVAALYMLLYSIGRFLIEFLRGDFRGNVGPFSTSQFISIIVFLLSLLLLNYERLRGVRDS
ncbi:phosphatidylglycerol:prolipoprotein diacylglycerol transferase [Caloramator fervidus]|uniref:Phosphatidylglycerol--prolipoprotein diacylglyceryl transferase n=1 Tax=Caloramator fervidus TaxID=29344 RepID=A0A1H5RJZ2_9CLOT|nr:prolipoprotein diacylglyceryl transferase [Caloramator fervidus]SEF38570.1 phosphatidylglycerol:prolipoprotein diacylglycerol transferase [Caloramator fervidus]